MTTVMSHSPADQQFAEGQKVKVSPYFTNGVNLRSGPMYDFPEIGEMPAETELTIVDGPTESIAGYYYQVLWGDLMGWVLASYLDPVVSQDPEPTQEAPTPDPSPAMPTSEETSDTPVLDLVLTSLRQLQGLVDLQEATITQLREENERTENAYLTTEMHRIDGENQRRVLQSIADSYQNQVRDLQAVEAERLRTITQLHERIRELEDERDNNSDLSLVESLKQFREGTIALFNLDSDVQYIHDICEELLGVIRAAKRMNTEQRAQFIGQAITNLLGEEPKQLEEVPSQPTLSTMKVGDFVPTGPKDEWAGYESEYDD